ncbi:MAG: AGE family epimerase/isomerase [Pseudomonadota bacterium]
MTHLFQEQSDRFLQWLQEAALPFWATRARDHKGGFFEALDLDGDPLLDKPKRLRVQARQAFSFARAEVLGLYGGRAASDHAYDFLLSHGRGDEGFVHTLHPDGSVLDSKLDLYDHAFVLLASAERYRAYQDERALGVARDVLTIIDGLRMKEGGYAEGQPHTLPRRQNPHMHLFEAFLTMRLANMPLDQDERLEEIRRLLKSAFYDKDAQVIREHFDQYWNLHPKKGQEVEPGHMVEWAWLAAEGGNKDLSVPLITKARAIGYQENTGLMVNSVDLSNGEHNGSCRLWPQTEHVRALTMLARWGEGDDDQAGLLLKKTMDRYFPEDLGGGYHDEFAIDGTQLSQHMPSSSLYHLITMADEIIRARQEFATS